MAACFGATGADFVHWLGGLITAFVPWPALILILLAFRSVRTGVGNFAGSFAELPRAVTAINMAGMKINLDPGRARELLSISSEVVQTDFERVVDADVRRGKIWDKFETVIQKGLIPLIATESTSADTEQSLYRVTLHVPDTLEAEMLYQLIEYYPPGPFPKSRGRRKSIRFGAIGKAWRLQKSDYSPTVSTQPAELIKDWGMTAEEADAAGRGRKTFLSVIIRDESKIPLGIFYMDALPSNFLGQKTLEEIEHDILEQCSSSKLTAELVKVRTKMQEQAARPKIR
ncbi:hypothetical protein [Bradyrhizobium neotropicale]|uniref:hypothetical protein n=1 Tax=Bradyrhizobium neotropicale TaxID=1497615 RepID=UPI001AD71357|nr:hypothetical protein [Bradyrhizobium neotropicale]MBO4227395.1 hypothetical protein [Bradyrhizobium neotropicale]